MPRSPKRPAARRAKGPAKPAGADARHEPAESPLRGEWLARMGHELRTPLNAIIGFIRLVEEGAYATENERRDYLGNARQSALSLLDLVNNILDLARIEAGRLSLESVALDPGALLEEVARTLAPEAHAKGVDIEAIVDPALPQDLRGDALRLRQVLYNLAGNAVKFTHTGLVLLRAELLPPAAPAATPAQEPAPCRIRFSVRDTGIGVPEALRAEIFESFVQSPQEGSATAGGVGLGLSIARQIVQQMGADIELDSREGEGSTFAFTVLLPSDGGPPPEAVPLPPAPLLLVDPDASTRAVCAEKLTGAGWSVRAVESADAALSYLATAQGGARRVRAVLVDSHVARDDVLVFARHLRRERGWYQPELLLLTTIGTGSSLTGLQDAGLTGYLTKPLVLDSLRDMLATQLERHGARGVPEPVGRPLAHEPVPEVRLERSANVLVAEDNAVNQKLISALLAKRGYRIELVSNGREAVEALRGAAYDLVLMDVQMPVLDGLAATRAIRQLPNGRAVPIIAMTADALDGHRERCLAAGMDDHVPKPIMPDLLAGKLARWLAPDAPEGGGRDAPGAGPGAAAEQPELLDLAHLDAVHAYGEAHDTERFADWVRLFCAEVDAARDALGAAHGTQERAALADALERLVLASAGFGAPALLALARAAQARLETLSADDRATLVGQIGEICRAVAVALHSRYGIAAPLDAAAEAGGDSAG